MNTVLTGLKHSRTPITPATHSAYVQTPHWQDLRVRKLRECGGWCEYPGCRRLATQLHHRSYARYPWYEYLDDLEAVCYQHHRVREQERQQERAARRRGKRRVAADSCGMVRRVSSPSQMTLPLRR